MGKTFFFVSSSNLSRPGAAQFRLLAIARGLSEHGARVNWILLATIVPHSIAHDEKYQSINFEIVGKRGKLVTMSRLCAYVYRFLLLATLGTVIRHQCFDSDHKALFSIGDSFLNLIMLRRLCRKEKILLFHERTEYPYLNATSLLKRLNLFLYLNIFIPQCDHIFVISTALREFFSTLPKVKRGNVPVSILNMLVETDRYQKSNKTEVTSYKDVVYVGTMYGDKDGVYNLIRAFGLIMDKIPEARLILVGDDKRKAQMAKVISALKSITDRSRVVFTGAINRMDVINKINNSYCLALARPDNIQAKFGFPTKLGEYLTTGRPVVVTAVGDIPLFLKDGDNAFIAEPDNIQSFASKLEECLSDEAMASAIGERGQKLVKEQFDYLAVTKVILLASEKGYAQ